VTGIGNEEMSLEEMTCWGKLFQIQAAETGKAQSLEKLNPRRWTVLVHKALHGLTLPYLSDDYQLVTEVRGQHLPGELRQ